MFKKGDKLRCLDDSGNCALTVGRVYVAQGDVVTYEGLVYIEVLCDIGTKQPKMITRFELVPCNRRKK